MSELFNFFNSKTMKQDWLASHHQKLNNLVCDIFFFIQINLCTGDFIKEK